MLNCEGFNLWADGYDKSVGLSDEDSSYPFAGYRDILNSIYNRILSSNAENVLDIGFGTGTLSCKLYEKGLKISGQDFSQRMIEIAKDKMPDAKLYCGDFSKGLLEPLKLNKYDAIIATYSLHHLTDDEKATFIKSLLPLLSDKGCIYIGDVAFFTRTELEKCKTSVGDEWDDEEIYFVYEELKAVFPMLEFEKFSPCAGLFTLGK